MTWAEFKRRWVDHTISLAALLVIVGVGVAATGLFLWQSFWWLVGLLRR